MGQYVFLDRPNNRYSSSVWNATYSEQRDRSRKNVFQLRGDALRRPNLMRIWLLYMSTEAHSSPCAMARINPNVKRIIDVLNLSFLLAQQIVQSSLKLKLYIVLSTIFSIFFQSERRWMNS